MGGHEGLWYEAAHRSSAPATHALVIGVSRYEHLPPYGRKKKLGLKQLDCGAATALHFATWLRHHFRAPGHPLASIRLFASPSEKECQMSGSTYEAVPAATGDNIEDALYAWEQDCQRNKGNIALLYICGHGVAEGGLTHVLLQDAFRNDNLINSFSLAPTQQALGAGTLDASLIFVDSCRQIPHKVDWDLGTGRSLRPRARGGRDSRKSAPIFFAATAGDSAYCRAGEPTFFCEGLLKCLEVRAARSNDEGRTWMVTKTSLEEELEFAVQELYAAQTVDVGGRSRAFNLHELPVPPALPLQLSLEPPASAASAHAELRRLFGGPEQPAQRFEGAKYQCQALCGKYRVTVNLPQLARTHVGDIWHAPPVGLLHSLQVDDE
jgi:hypothetical protein